MLFALAQIALTLSYGEIGTGFENLRRDALLDTASRNCDSLSLRLVLPLEKTRVIIDVSHSKKRGCTLVARHGFGGKPVLVADGDRVMFFDSLAGRLMIVPNIQTVVTLEAGGTEGTLNLAFNYNRKERSRIAIDLRPMFDMQTKIDRAGVRLVSTREDGTRWIANVSSKTAFPITGLQKDNPRSLLVRNLRWNTAPIEAPVSRSTIGKLQQQLPSVVVGKGSVIRTAFEIHAMLNTLKLKLVQVQQKNPPKTAKWRRVAANDAKFIAACRNAGLMPARITLVAPRPIR